MNLMKEVYNKICNDLKESQIDLKVIIAFIPVAFITYLFHESGHWTFGELSGNDMLISLNNCTPRNGKFIKDTDALWSAIGGPLFTIIQAIIFMFFTWLTKSVYAYSITFFAIFSRFFSLIFGGLDLQDEAGIARILDWNKYLVAGIVLTILILILLRCNKIMKFNLKATGYFTVLGVYAILIVLGINALIITR
jgi:hypothetical protein